MDAHDENTQQQDNGTVEQWKDRNAPITIDFSDINNVVQSVDLIA